LEVHTAITDVERAGAPEYFCSHVHLPEAASVAQFRKFALPTCLEYWAFVTLAFLRVGLMNWRNPVNCDHEQPF